MNRLKGLVDVSALMLALSVSGCAADASRKVEVPGTCAASSHASEPTSLPRFVEVRVVGAEVWVAGEPQSSERLGKRLKQEGQDARNQGVVLSLPADMPAEEGSNWVALLLTAGFSQVVVNVGGHEAVVPSEGTAPSKSSSTPVEKRQSVPIVPAAAEAAPSGKSSADSGSPNAERATAAPIQETAAPEAASGDFSRGNSLAVTPPKVEVKQMGLHVGGGPNTEEEIARFTTPIQRHFAEFRACYPLAKGTRKAASFGVDLLIPARGGRAKIRDFRTVLSGKEFLTCMIDIFGAVEFEKPGRSVVVSYSLLFKPTN